MVLLALPAAEAVPTSFETPVLEDPVDDTVQSGLDVVSLGHWTSYYYDSEHEVHRGFFLNLCVGFANLPAAPDGARVHVFVRVNDTVTEYWADIGFVGAKVVISDRNTNATANQTSVTFNLPFGEAGLAVGQPVTEIFVATSTSNPVLGRLYHDLMPFDNEGRPSVNLGEPEERGNLVVADPYPFLTLTPTTPLTQDTILGAPVRFRVTVTPAPGLRSDVVRFFPDVTPGWNLTQNYEYLGPFSEQPMDLTFELARANATIGEVGQATIRVISTSGAYQVLGLTARVVSRFADAPERFEVTGFGGAKAGQVRDLTFTILDAEGTPQPGTRVELEASYHGRRVGATNATTDAEGVVHWPVRFDRVGTWTVRAALPDEAPTPTLELQVEVAAQEAPQPSLWTSLAIVAIIMAVSRRRA
jgi:hypothetical protein